MDQSRLLARVVRMGGGVAITLLVPTILGLAMDSRFGTRPWGTLAALFIASLGAMYIVVRMTFDFYASIKAAPPSVVPPSIQSSSIQEDENE